jgi:hypothetical protein
MYAILLPSGEKLVRSRERLGGATLGRDKIKPRCANRWCYRAIGAKQHVLTVWRPAQDDIVAGVIGEALRLAAVDSDNVHVRVAIVGRSERDPFSVRRKFRIELVTRAGCKAPCSTALTRTGPAIAGVGENESISRNVGAAGCHQIPLKIRMKDTANCSGIARPDPRHLPL